VVELVPVAVTCVWLGMLASISPCPMATNVAAVSYIGRTLGAPGRVVVMGALYAAGRMAAYVGIGALLVYSLLSAPALSHWLQKYMIRVLGPLLLIAGILLMGWLPISLPRLSVGSVTQQRLARSGAGGAAVLGFLFALTFCPVSAALFFGSLLPLAVENRSAVLLPSLYGLGTALPVMGFAVVIAAGVGGVGRMFDRIARFEQGARVVTALVFFIVGTWMTATYVVGL
jgi:cytochrome c-type biogenesis protein